MPETPIELAERALSYADGEALVTVVHERSLASRFARSAPTQATGVDDTAVEILCLRDGHTASASTNRLDEDSLRATARKADAVARAAALAGHGDHPGLPSPTPAQAAAGWDAETAELDPAAGADALRTAFAGAASAGLEAFGLWSAGAVRTALATSTGVRATDDVTDAFMKVVCRDANGRSGYAAHTARTVAELDATALTARAIEQAPREDGVALEPGEYPVVLSADAVAVLLEFAGWLAFNGLAHAERRGALSGRLGETIAAPAIDLSDAPGSGLTLARAWDAEGVPKATVALVRGGVAEGVVHDLRSAAVAGDGARSTGHAVEAGGSPEGPIPTNLVLAGGSAADEAALAAPIERGIYVTRLWYVNAVHERQVLLTGMTRDGTFLIEDGRIGPPVRDVRFTDSVLRILEETEDLTVATRLVSEGEFYGRRFANGVVCPALRARGFRVTGATR
jgi:predicted Zn-dependent protease